MEKIDWTKPVELMDGAKINSISESAYEGYLTIYTDNALFRCDEDGCVGGVQIVRNANNPSAEWAEGTKCWVYDARDTKRYKAYFLCMSTDGRSDYPITAVTKWNGRWEVLGWQHAELYEENENGKD